MGIFDKIFGKKPSTPESFEMEPTGEMMGEDRYWRLIADSLDYAEDDQEAQLAFLRRELAGLAPEEIVGFRLRTDKLLYDTYTSEMWCAGWIMNGGCSDDSFEYFRLWVISRGREVYENARRDPDSLISVADTPVPEGLFDLESLWYVANDAFEQKTGKDLHDHIADTFKFNEANYPDLQFNWTEEDPESWRKICPKLFERFSDGI
jgi:hypothetical protein